MFKPELWQSHDEYRTIVSKIGRRLSRNYPKYLFADFEQERQKLLNLNLDPLTRYIPAFYSEGGRPAKHHAQILRFRKSFSCSSSCPCRPDSKNFLFAIDDFSRHCHGLTPKNICIDSTHDNIPTYELLERWDINALIDINGRAKPSTIFCRLLLKLIQIIIYHTLPPWRLYVSHFHRKYNLPCLRHR